VNLVAFRSRAASSGASDPEMTPTANGHVVRSSALSPEVQSAMRALREMPPFAREREIDFGRYSYLTPAERNVLRHTDFDH
jgi:hypothetical protein